MTWAGVGEREIPAGDLVGKPEGKSPLGRPRHRISQLYNKYNGRAWTGLIWLIVWGK